MLISWIRLLFLRSTLKIKLKYFLFNKKINVKLIDVSATNIYSLLF